jgi:hypothetical protein
MGVRGWVEDDKFVHISLLRISVLLVDFSILFRS